MALISQLVSNNLVDLSSQTYQPVKMNINSYTDPMVLFHGNASDLNMDYSNYIGSPGSFIEASNFSAYLLEEAEKSLAEYRKKYIIGADFMNVRQNVYF